MLAELLLLTLLLGDLLLVAAGRLQTAIRIIAAQGAALALLPLVLILQHDGGENVVHLLWLTAGTLVVKAIVIPSLLAKAARAADVQCEASSYAGTIAGFGLAIVAMLVSTLLPIDSATHPGLLLPTAFTSVLIGFLLLISGRNAIRQVMGYLTLENGVVVFGQLLTAQMPLIVELGILLDVLAGVAIMSIVIFQISRVFQHIDTHSLSDLRH